MQKFSTLIKNNTSYIFLALIVFLTLKIFIPQLEDLKESFLALKEADIKWIIAGICVFFTGLPIVAWQYLVLALKPIPFGLTLLVETAGLFVSKLLPSSLGTLSLNIYYFVKQKHTVLQSTTVMAMNAITSGIAYAALIALALAASDFSFSLDGIDPSATASNIFGIILAVLALAAFLTLRTQSIKQRVIKSVTDLKKSLGGYKERPSSVVYGIILNGVGSFTSLFALYASAQAVGLDLSIAQALVAYTFGNVAAGLVPTPGGIGAAEAGIYAGLIIVGVPSVPAITVTLLYRLISYWLPIIPGYIAFWNLRKNVLADFSLKHKPTN